MSWEDRSPILGRLFTATSALSLLLCMAVLVLWVRSYAHQDEVIFRHAIAYSSGGSIGIQVWPENRGFTLVAIPTPSGTAHLLQWPSRGSIPPSVFTFPDLLLLGLFLALPLLWSALWLRRRKLQQLGYCSNCGYDLRATPHRCPECGTVPGQQVSRPAQPEAPTDRLPLM